jgi:DNA-binding CsgD family transcriptional regulator
MSQVVSKLDSAPLMSHHDNGPTLDDRLRSVRHCSFVGRAPELAAFRELLSDASRSFLFLWGQFGVGKSALLAECKYAAIDAGHTAITVDAQELAVCAGAPDNPKWQLLVRELSGGSHHERRARGVLLVDAFEGVAAPHSLVERLRCLSSDVLVVFASRTQIPPAFLLDNAWSALTQMLEVRPLQPEEAAALLHQRQVPAPMQPHVLEFAGGFPLALEVMARLLNGALAGQSLGDCLLEAEHQLGRLACPLPLSAAELLAFDASLVARTLTPDLLDSVQRAIQVDAALERVDGYNWLARQSFVQWTRQGLEPHSLVRSALGARLKRERPRRYQLIQEAIRDAVVADLMASSDPGQALRSLIFLYRDLPGVIRWAPGVDELTPTIVPTCPREREEVLEFLREVEGRESADLAARGLWAQEGVFETLRGPDTRALLVTTRFDAATLPRRLPPNDPVTAPIRRYVAEHGFAEGQESLIFRWAVDREGYRPWSTGALALLGRKIQVLLTTPNLPYSFSVVRADGNWEEFWTDIGTPWRRLERFELGGHEHSLMVFDWRRRSLHELFAKPLFSRDSAAATESRPSDVEHKVKVAGRIAALARKSSLTPREAEILEQLCLGHHVEVVAKHLDIRPRTVKFHLENLLRKTRAGSRSELMRMLL